MIEDNKSTLIATFTQLKSQFNQMPSPAIDKRLRLLSEIKTKLLQLQDQFVIAADKDFGGRSRFDTVIADIMPCINSIDYISKHIHKWSRTQRRFAGAQWLPSTARVEVVPKGVVGVIAPWNYPIQLAVVPVITALAAGNKVMLKLSEFTPQVNQVIRSLFKGLEDEVSVIEGGPEIASTFTQQPFDHLLFTGSTAVGKKVMAAAAQNLTPVTLELGGKSPVIVLEDTDVDAAAMSILMGKLSNSGQICVAPDYVLVHESQYDALISALKKGYENVYKPKVGLNNQTAIINDTQHQRLRHIIEDAKEKGAQVWQAEPIKDNRQLPLHLITHVDKTMQVMQEELFGTVLPILKVASLHEAIAFIREDTTPLASYLFTQSESAINKAARELATGTLAINETIVHVAVESLPFGGLGHSGMGQYHGEEGFYTFSHKKPVLQSRNTKWRNKMLLTHSKLLTKPLEWLFLRKK
ncbi:aldehyde dehydrogenase family protein [Pseudoalteromonas piscicida]|uniref:Aldehyde dehydrogenase n=1 Tax=Pseudoalteromonas piscicida TaxID=43662 RepID=A0A2A5JTZ3_PSEO7|nr:aldehyde dehydrogenase family protein [Pseudoalteromonas piscicida]PCK32819.1 coniferyl-aldehyde dehydrogenase [Pseudoalteromonas piscicida]